jgi:hypothetical protein
MRTLESDFSLTDPGTWGERAGLAFGEKYNSGGFDYTKSNGNVIGLTIAAVSEAKLCDIGVY